MTQEKKPMMLWFTLEDMEIGLVFRWDGKDWVCKVEDDYFRELSPLPMEETE